MIDLALLTSATEIQLCLQNVRDLSLTDLALLHPQQLRFPVLVKFMSTYMLKCSVCFVCVFIFIVFIFFHIIYVYFGAFNQSLSSIYLIIINFS